MQLRSTRRATTRPAAFSTRGGVLQRLSKVRSVGYTASYHCCVLRDLAVEKHRNGVLCIAKRCFRRADAPASQTAIRPAVPERKNAARRNIQENLPRVSTTARLV